MILFPQMFSKIGHDGSELPSLSDLAFKRCYYLAGKKVHSQILYGFSDTTQSGYACVIYLHVVYRYHHSGCCSGLLKNQGNSNLGMVNDLSGDVVCYFWIRLCC